jgi:hypothetical protein
MIIATNAGYHEGLGLAIAALSAFALGMLALLPERQTAPQDAPTIPHPVLEHEPEPQYNEPVSTP